MEEEIGVAELTRIMREEYGIRKEQWTWLRLARLGRIPARKDPLPPGPYRFKRSDLDEIARSQGWSEG